MKKHVTLFIVTLATLSFLSLLPVSAISSPPTGQLAYFYTPPTDGTSIASVAALNRYLILTHGAETYRSSLRTAGYGGPILEYLGAAQVDGPGPYANSSVPCDTSFQPLHSQVAMNPGDFCAYLHPNESYFLHNAQGQRLYENNGNGHYTYHMNPGAAGWQQFFIQRALREKQNLGYNGIFLDNVWISLWTLTNQVVVNSGGSYPHEYMTDSSYQSAMVGFLIQLRRALAGWPMVANLASDNFTSTSWNVYLPYLDGAMNEAYAAGWPSDGYPTASEWLTDIQKAETAIGQGKTVLAITQGDQRDIARMRFGYGSYLLIMQPGLAYYRYALASNGYEYQWTYSDYSTDIGTPLGARYQQSDGAWQRNFTRGYVVVNPNNQSVQIVQQVSPPQGHWIFLPLITRSNPLNPGGK